MAHEMYCILYTPCILAGSTQNARVDPPRPRRHRWSGSRARRLRPVFRPRSLFVGKWAPSAECTCHDLSLLCATVCRRVLSPRKSRVVCDGRCRRVRGHRLGHHIIPWSGGYEVGKLLRFGKLGSSELLDFAAGMLLHALFAGWAHHLQHQHRLHSSMQH